VQLQQKGKNCQGYLWLKMMPFSLVSARKSSISCPAIAQGLPMTANKEANLFPGRAFYRAGGGTQLGLFSLWMLLALGAAALLAVVLFWLFIEGYYYFVIVPFAAEIAVGSLVWLAVVKGHCRNWMLAAFAGIFAGMVLYFGSFYCGMVYHWGAGVAAHPNLLPAYISARMNTDMVRDDNRPDVGTKEPVPGVNWLLFGFEALCVAGIGASFGTQPSQRPYCEICGRWMVRHVTSFPPNASSAVMNALRAHSANALAELCATPAYPSSPNLTVVLDVCPSLEQTRSRGCPVYISVKQLTQRTSKPVADPINKAQGKLLVRMLAATSSEVAALAPRFKTLASANVRPADLQPKMAAPVPSQTPQLKL
jgi:hypothetical protein